MQPCFDDGEAGAIAINPHPLNRARGALRSNRSGALLAFICGLENTAIFMPNSLAGGGRVRLLLVDESVVETYTDLYT